MVPSTWLSIALFAIFVAPGLLFDLLSDRRRAGYSESTFREISRVVLASLIISGLVVLVLALVRTVKPEWMPDPRRVVAANADYVQSHYRLIFRTLVLQVLLGLGAAWGAHTLLAKRQGGATIRRVSAWTQVFKRDRPKGHDTYVRVRLSSGTVYSGLVANYSVSLASEGRELVLAQPMASRRRPAGMPPFRGSTSVWCYAGTPSRC